MIKNVSHFFLDSIDYLAKIRFERHLTKCSHLNIPKNNVYYKQSFMLYVVKSLIDEIKCQCTMISPISLIHKRLRAGR